MNALLLWVADVVQAPHKHDGVRHGLRDDRTGGRAILQVKRPRRAIHKSETRSHKWSFVRHETAGANDGDGVRNCWARRA
jgi:hypothetical protein